MTCGNGRHSRDKDLVSVLALSAIGWRLRARLIHYI
jgi:hypothetical protein